MIGKLFRNLYQKKVVIIAVIILTTAAVGGYLYITRDTSPIPPQVRKQLTFSPFVIPVETKNYSTTNYNFSTAEEEVQILSYKINATGWVISISEYPQPPQFAEIPEYKSRFLDNVAKQYETVSTSSGTIYLGRAVKLNNKQLGVMLERGLLVFLSPDKDLSEDQWRKLGDQMEIEKVAN